MLKSASKIFLIVVALEILAVIVFITVDSANAATVNYQPVYLKGFGGNPAELVVSIYRYALGAVGIVALGAIIYGAILRITSAGNPSQVQEANAWIIGAVSGIALLFGAYLILQTINPQLVKIGEIEKMITPTIKVTPPGNPFVKSIDEYGYTYYTCQTTLPSSSPTQSGVYSSEAICKKQCSGANRQCILFNTASSTFRGVNASSQEDCGPNTIYDSTSGTCL